MNFSRFVRNGATRARLDIGDVLEQARASQGLERLDQIRYAILERDGSISIIPQS